MSAMQKRKGKEGELELARLLSERLGTAIRRNLSQSHAGGHDLLIPGWAVEVKRAANPQVATWWQQTLLQARHVGSRPVTGLSPRSRLLVLCGALNGPVANASWSVGLSDGQALPRWLLFTCQRKLASH